MDPIAHAERLIDEQFKAGVAGGWLRTRSEAIHNVRRTVAAIIADDMIDGKEPWVPRLESYRYLRELDERAMAEQAAMLARIDGAAK